MTVHATSETTKTSRTWIGAGGEVFCTDHAGRYLKSAATAAPAAVEHHTPLGHWIDTRLTGETLPCELCT